MFSAFCRKHSGLANARFGVNKEGEPKAALFAGGEGLQHCCSPVMKRKSFVGCQMLASSDIIYVKTGL